MSVNPNSPQTTTTTVGSNATVKEAQTMLNLMNPSEKNNALKEVKALLIAEFLEMSNNSKKIAINDFIQQLTSILNTPSIVTRPSNNLLKPSTTNYSAPTNTSSSQQIQSTSMPPVLQPSPVISGGKKAKKPASKKPASKKPSKK